VGRDVGSQVSEIDGYLNSYLVKHTLRILFEQCASRPY
jgi:hypothetical protein